MPKNKDKQNEKPENRNVWLDTLLDDYKDSFKKLDPYAVWIAVECCNEHDANYPEWVKTELDRIAKAILQKENPGKSYPEYIGKEILNMNGHIRRGSDKAKKDFSIWTRCRTGISKREKRKDLVTAIAKELGINQRQVEDIYDRTLGELKKRGWKKIPDPNPWPDTWASPEVLTKAMKFGEMIAKLEAQKDSIKENYFEFVKEIAEIELDSKTTELEVWRDKLNNQFKKQYAEVDQMIDDVQREVELLIKRG